MTAAAQPFVSVDNVVKRFAARGRSLTAVDNVSLDMNAGEFVAIVGPSGCGKSTLMMMMSGLTPISTGRITIAGEEIHKPYTDVGIVFQRDALLEWRTVLDNVLLQIDVRRLDRRAYIDKARALLKQVGLAEFENYRPHELSGGMRQRVSLCRALIHDPQLILMDEPFGALDAMTREQMNVDLQQLWMENRKTMLFITHSIWEAIFLADRVIVMSPRPGRIARDISIDLPRPRRLAVRETPAFGQYTAEIRTEFQNFGLLVEP
jgi:NitT/TauT family transport system ATP-binding protein